MVAAVYKIQGSDKYTKSDNQGFCPQYVFSHPHTLKQNESLSSANRIMEKCLLCKEKELTIAEPMHSYGNLLCSV